MGALSAPTMTSGAAQGQGGGGGKSEHPVRLPLQHCAEDCHVCAEDNARLGPPGALEMTRSLGGEPEKGVL